MTNSPHTAKTLAHTEKKLDWKRLQDRIREPASEHGYWQSLSELADRESQGLARRQEFPAGADRWPADADDWGTSRRRFLRIMGASLALAGLNGCRQPEEKILPYVETPETIVPGEPLFFATAMPQHGYAQGVVVESHEGRPTKIEGNRLHPASRGATNALAQASVLTLYDPDRSQTVMEDGIVSSRERFRGFWRDRIKQASALRGSGLRILTPTITSPTLVRQITHLSEVLPELRWHHFDPVSGDNELLGTESVFGQPLQAVYDFTRAAAVLAIGGDFLDPNRSPPSYAGDFIERRRLTRSGNRPWEMSRLYAVGSTPSLTSTKADHRLRLSPPEVVAFTRALAERLGVGTAGEKTPLPTPVPAEWIDAVENDLREYRLGSETFALVVAGYDQPAEVHALAHAINHQLGSVGEGKAVHYLQPIHAGDRPQLESLRELTEAMSAGEVETLLILDGNPVFNAPADFGFRDALGQVPHRVHWGLYANETASACRWHLPALHYLEAWSDIRAYNGEASIIQPLIAPLYDGISRHELLESIVDDEQPVGYELVRETWREHFGGYATEQAWEMALKKGVVPDTRSAPVDVSYDGAAVSSDGDELDRGAEPLSETDETAETIHLVFHPDPSIDDGQYANNAWLQELPKPHSKLTWDNAALVSPALARRMQLNHGDLVRIEHDGTALQVPVWVTPGQAEKTVTLHFGYGGQMSGDVARGTGFNVYPLRTSRAFWSAAGATLEKVGTHYPLATTQEHFLMEGRHPVERGSLEELRKHPRHPPFLHHAHHPTEASLYPEWEYDGYKWGMSVDLTSCIGCNACVVACQSENNIPVVGKEQVAMGREMHWMRIDTYFHGPLDDPDSFLQPVMCQHCEKAPCEVVCPVSATTHSEEGINEMTYNRCVGTRYCGNNCPYKVRRFNYLQYADEETPVMKLLRNPDVTVRSRGVMEKCTYCIQRINQARIEADLRDGTIETGDVRTACQAACPTRAIEFGNLNNPEEVATQWKENALNYRLLDDLNVQPRTSYLANISNPNPSLAGKPSESPKHGE